MEPASELFAAMEFIAHSYCARSLTHSAARGVNVIMLSCVLETSAVVPQLCSVNAPLIISSVLHQWNLGIITWHVQNAVQQIFTSLI